MKRDDVRFEFQGDDMSIFQRIGIAIVWVAWLAGCDEPPPPTTNTATALTDDSGAPSALPVASAAPAPSSSVTAPPAEPPCAAPEDGKLATLGKLAEPVVAMTEHRNYVYALAWAGGKGEGAVYRMHKRGEQAEAIAKLHGRGNPRSIAADDNGVFFTKAKRLLRVSAEPEAPAVVLEGFPSRMTIYDGYIYAAGRDKNARGLSFVRISTRDGAAVERLAVSDASDQLGLRWEHIAVDRGGVYFTDTGGAQLVSVPHTGGAVTEHVHGHHLEHVALAAEQIYWTAGYSVYRSPRTEDKRVKVATTPDSRAKLWSGRDNIFFYTGEAVHPQLPTVVELHAIPRAGGEPRKVDAFRNDIDHVTDDGTCVYLARSDAWTTRVQARVLPP